MVCNSYLPRSPRSAIGKFGKILDFSWNRRRSKRATPSLVRGPSTLTHKIRLGEDFLKGYTESVISHERVYTQSCRLPRLRARGLARGPVIRPYAAGQ
jgi:hypothetical protein